MSPKEKIYKILHEARTVVSGEDIRAALGVSRVAVWKHIQGMIKSGISIESSPKGYLLRSDSDSLLPYEFGKRQDRVHYFTELPSTMDKAIELARGGCRANTVVIAGSQQEGRGRMRRAWNSGEGGLYFSVVVRPDIPVNLAGIVNLAVAIDMTAVLRTRCRVAATVKWPNDILVDGKKICGILSQMETEGDYVDYITIGVGLNVNNVPAKEIPNATSLKVVTGGSLARKEILTAFLDRFEKRISAFDPGEVLDQWKAVNSTIGKAVHIVTINSTFSGEAVAIDSQGGLVLQKEDGKRQTVIYGDCFYK
ncbi:biotin--[acetyl-CoA-carboxylase] ligase [Desulforhopalus singaporensis]|uniref:Bifunctional ligase/repressor BirA n=1 Tax=Desulforhopalus singaporensis TaxID=91360 RepID=A0A1H0RWF5_9BACT|nr:biotin--[acetyl-CoA-carboxylase] ligase [Desulforhopalus singaporensis]SDP33902.1 BirA family transcriptional regulator, biotin operon repressor / biotin-[acetyl-CoA-carboxylase] ligase [Desulforhopalus singaporensis]